MRCQCIDCPNPADRNVGGKMVCDTCYLQEGHLFFKTKKPFPTERVLLTIIIVLMWLVMDVVIGTRSISDLVATAISAAVRFNLGWELTRIGWKMIRK